MASTTLRKTELKFLKAAGFKYFKANSNFKVPYLICLGDYFSENPYFKPDTNTEEIIASVAWCLNKEKPVIFDIGAHCGYFSAHFSALLQKFNPRIFSVEPVTETYFDLVHTIDKLQLHEFVCPIHGALSNKDEMVSLSYSRWESMLAHVITSTQNDSVWKPGKHIALATTLKRTCEFLNVFPDMIKLDVEGYESFVLEGAGSILQADNKPAICIEWNPATLQQCGSSAETLASLLAAYDLYYLNDYEFGKKKFLEKIPDPNVIPWVCNLFALPKGAANFERWYDNINELKTQYNITIA